MDGKNCVLETLHFEIKQLEKENIYIAIKKHKVEIYDLNFANEKARRSLIS